jgi:hypothetical protein
MDDPHLDIRAPMLACFGNVLIQITETHLPFEEAHATHTRELEKIRTEFSLRVVLNPDSTRRQSFTNVLLDKIHQRGYPLYNITLASTLASTRTMKFLTCWELYGIVRSHIVAQIGRKKETVLSNATGYRKKNMESAGVKLRPFMLKSFHIADNNSSSINSLRSAVKMMESEVTIIWTYVATYTDDRTSADEIEHLKDKSRWITSIASQDCCKSNLLFWSNKILTGIKKIDIVVSDSHDSIGALAFVFKLETGGSAVIRIQNIVSPKMVSMIHAAALCFSQVTLHHTPDDEIYLVCCGFKGMVSKSVSNVFDFLNATASSSLFSSDCMKGVQFTQTVEAILQFTNGVYAWRQAYYQKILTLHRRIVNLGGVKDSIIDAILDDEFPDRSSEWKKAVGYDFVGL